MRDCTRRLIFVSGQLYSAYLHGCIRLAEAYIIMIVPQILSPVQANSAPAIVHPLITTKRLIVQAWEETALKLHYERKSVLHIPRMRSDAGSDA